MGAGCADGGRGSSGAADASVDDVVNLAVTTRPSPGSTTMEDVLDSLLGLPPPSRSPSPGPAGLSASSSTSAPPTAATPTSATALPPGAGRGTAYARRSCGDLRLEPAGRRTV